MTNKYRVRVLEKVERFMYYTVTAKNIKQAKKFAADGVLDDDVYNPDAEEITDIQVLEARRLPKTK